MVEPEPRPDSAPGASSDDGHAEADEAHALVTHEVGPDDVGGGAASLLPSGLSDAAGSSEFRDPLLAAVAAAPSAPAARERELEAGSRIGQSFRIERRLGSGGMGVVYLARDESLDRSVAVKLHRAGAGVDRLQREAMAMARLTHPNVITVHEVGRLGDRVFVAMEFVPGGTLRAWLKARPRPWRDALTLCLAAGEGLVAAHEAGLVHRDFKPENVLVGDDGRPRVGDFGLARAVGESANDLVTSELTRSGLHTPAPSNKPTVPNGPAAPVPAVDAEAATELLASDAVAHPPPSLPPPAEPPPAEPPAQSTPASLPAPAPMPTPDPRNTPPATPDYDLDRSHRGLLSDRLTMTGMLVGTPAYMSPEQFAGGDVDARADQFAFAVMTWEALHGKRPFAGADQRVLRAAVEAGRILAPPKDSPVPARVRAVLVRALSVSPAKRWPTTRAMLDALRDAARPSRRRLWIGLGAAGVVAAAALAWAAWPREQIDPCRTAVPAMDRNLTPATIDRVIAAVDAAPGDRQLLDRVKQRLSVIRPRLHEAALASCKAARVDRSTPAELEARSTGCLTLRARATSLLVDDPALAVSDPAAYLSRLRALPSVVPCLDAVALAATLPRHDDAAITARAKLWAASADARADRYAAAQSGAKAALAVAAPDDRGAHALATMVEGQIAYAQDRLAEAQRLFTDAYYAGVALDDTDIYLQALQLLVVLHGSDRFEASEAAPWIRAGAAAIEKDRRRAPAAVAELLGALVGAADNLGDSAQAIAWAEQSVKMISPGADPGSRGEAELSLARALHGGGRYDEAIARYQGAIEDYIAALGPTHPRTAEVLTDYGLLLVDAGKDDLVPPIVERIRLALAAWPGARSSARATALLNLGVLLTDDPADFAEADRSYREARATFVAIHGPEHPDVALCDANLAVLENKRGNHVLALAALDRAIAIQEKALGPDHFQVAATSYNIAAAALLARDYVRAEPAAARAESFFAKQAPGESRHLFSMNLRAKALSGLGHHAAALAIAERSEQMSITSDGAAGVGAGVEIARALMGLGRELDRAAALLEVAHREFSKFPAAYVLTLADVDALRAELEKR